jgi:peptidoglycan/LPS O-acetylase OafA/YrhL
MFYERRARRILPALFTVLAASSLFACLWMLPDELKNYGQSLIATTLFSNNILLAFTTGYWAMASEFKPLLHTWSLGAEEQYYVFFPLLLYVCWFLWKKRIAIILGLLVLVSISAAIWGSLRHPDASFYLLPTRAWEIFVGALAAIYLAWPKKLMVRAWMGEVLSGLGVLLIVFGVFFIRSGSSTAQLYAVIPVFGAVLIVLFALPSNVAGKLLGRKAMVGIGLVSYSLYLWHQPFFAFARIYSRNPPSHGMYAILILAAIATSYLSWRYVERPCRDKKLISRRSVFQVSLIGSVAFLALGAYLIYSYGMLFRMYDPGIAPVSTMDKRIYNERVFMFEKARFSDAQKLRILVTGDSFGRDFINMTIETFDTRNVEIVYRHELRQCIYPFKGSLEETLYSQAEVVVFNTWDPKSNCIQGDNRFLESHHKAYFYIGSKRFGYNLNWIVRLRPSDRPNRYNRLPQDVAVLESQMAAAIPSNHYISLLASTVKDGNIPITDERGYLISTDRAHLTKFGAIFFGRKVELPSRYGNILIEAALRKRV